MTLSMEALPVNRWWRDVRVAHAARGASIRVDLLRGFEKERLDADLAPRRDLNAFIPEIEAGVRGIPSAASGDLRLRSAERPAEAADGFDSGLAVDSGYSFSMGDRP